MSQLSWCICKEYYLTCLFIANHRKEEEAYTNPTTDQKVCTRNKTGPMPGWSKNIVSRQSIDPVVFILLSLQSGLKLICVHQIATTATHVLTLHYL